MNFTTAYAFLKQGCRITRPGMSCSLKMEKNRLMREICKDHYIPVTEVTPEMVDMFAQTDWCVLDAEIGEDTDKVVIQYKKIVEPGWKVPAAPYHAHEDDRGFDLTCVAREQIRKYVWRYHSGLAFAFPDGIDGEIRARSSVHKTGLLLSNGVGTIDHGYTGEVQAVFYELLIDDFGTDHYQPGDRFAQLVIPGVDPRNVVFIEVDQLPQTTRGVGGYGSTGK